MVVWAEMGRLAIFASRCAARSSRIDVRISSIPWVRGDGIAVDGAGREHARAGVSDGL